MELAAEIQKAVDLLEELRAYESDETVIVEQGVPPKMGNAASYERLSTLWNERGKLKPSEFIDFIYERAPDLAELYIMINKFIAYVDLAEFIKNNEISERAIRITTFALCSFANIGSIGFKLAD